MKESNFIELSLEDMLLPSLFPFYDISDVELHSLLFGCEDILVLPLDVLNKMIVEPFAASADLYHENDPDNFLVGMYDFKTHFA